METAQFTVRLSSNLGATMLRVTKNQRRAIMSVHEGQGMGSVWFLLIVIVINTLNTYHHLIK